MGVFSLALYATVYKIFYSLECHNTKATKIIHFLLLVFFLSSLKERTENCHENYPIT